MEGKGTNKLLRTAVLLWHNTGQFFGSDGSHVWVLLTRDDYHSHMAPIKGFLQTVWKQCNVFSKALNPS